MATETSWPEVTNEVSLVPRSSAVYGNANGIREDMFPFNLAPSFNCVIEKDRCIENAYDVVGPSENSTR